MGGGLLGSTRRMDPVTRYEDRRAAETYADDPLVLVRRASQSVDDGLWFPERVARRLLQVGRAYELHYLGEVAGESAPTMLTAAQCETLADELDFIRDVVNDPVLVGMVDLVAAEAAICARTGDSLILDFEL